MSEKKKNPFQGIVTYFKEVRAELKKVAWPTLKQIKNNTVIVIVCLIFVGAIIWVLDLGFSKTLGEVVNIAGQTQEDAAPQQGVTDTAPQGSNQLTPEQMDELNKQMQQQQQQQGEGEQASEAAPQQNNEQ